MVYWKRALLSAALSEKRTKRLKFSAREKAAFTVGIIILVLTFLGSTLYPPVSSDALEIYSLRTFMWQQNASNAFFPTYAYAMLFSSTLVDNIIVQINILSNSEVFGSLIQWFSLLGCGVVSSLIAQSLGCRKKGQIIAALAALSMPLAVLQSTGPKHDLTTAFFASALVFFIVRIVRNAKGSLTLAQFILAGLAFGLCGLGKTTGILICLPFCLWGFVHLIRAKKLVLAFKGLAIITFCFFLIFAPTLKMNSTLLGRDVFGLHAPGMNHILVRDTSPKDLCTNAIRNMLMPFSAPMGRVNMAITTIAERSCKTVGLDLNQSANKENAATTFELSTHPTNPDMAGAFFWMLWLIISLILLGLFRVHSKGLGAYLACFAVGVWALAILIVWQPYINRTFLQVLMLGAPLIGLASERAQEQKLSNVIFLLLLGTNIAFACLLALFNSFTPLLPQNALPGRSSASSVGFWNTSTDDLYTAQLLPDLTKRQKKIIAQINAYTPTRVGVWADAKTRMPIYSIVHALKKYRPEILGDLGVCSSHFQPQKHMNAFLSERSLILCFSYTQDGYKNCNAPSQCAVISQVYFPEIGAWATVLKP